MITRLALFFCICSVSLKGIALYAHENDAREPKSGFIQNIGQWDNPSQYLFPLKNAQIFFETNAIQYFFEDAKQVDDFFNHTLNPHLLKSATINRHAVRMDFLTANKAAKISGNFAFKHYLNYFVGNNPKHWKSHVPVYEELIYKQLYPGIDMKLPGNTANHNLKYEFYVAPGADPLSIKMKYSGLNALKLNKGQLVFNTSINNWIESKPYAYQLVGGKIKQVVCSFVITGDVVSFKLGKYDTSKELIIDPLLVFSTYSGSGTDNFGHSATYDNSGNLYTAGIVRNPGFNGYPVTQGAFQTTWAGGTSSFPCDIAISKYNNDGSALLYATYLGGAANDYPISVVVDDKEQLIVLGAALSLNYPTTDSAYDRTRSDTFDLVITRFNADGSALVGSTYIGGSGIDGINAADSLRMNYADEFRGEVQITPSGDIVVVSSTSSNGLFSGIPSFQPNKNDMQDGLIVLLDSALKRVKGYTYLGQNKHDALYSLDIDNSGNFVVVGGTQSTTFSPTVGFEWANYKGGFAEGLIARFNPTLTNMLGIRYWGSPAYDQVYFVKLDPQQNVVVMGQGFDSVGVTNGVYANNDGSIFVTKFTPTLSNIIFSTHLGNGTKVNALSPSAFMVDVCGSIYGSLWGGNVNFQSRYAELDRNRLTGVYRTFSSSTLSLPTVGTQLIAGSDGSDFWIFSLNQSATQLQYASYFGENGGNDHVDGGTSRFDKRGIIYQSVCASCDKGPAGTFPTTAGSFSPKNKSPRCSNAGAKIDFRQGDILTANFNIKPRNGCTDSVIFFENTSYNGQKFYWYINDVLRDSSYHLTDTFKLVGKNKVKLVVLDNGKCNPIDSIVKTFSIFPSSNAQFTVTRDTCSSILKFTNKSTSINNQPVPFTWYFGDGNTSKDTNPTYSYQLNGSYKVQLITGELSQCADTAETTIIYDTSGFKLRASFTPSDSLQCEPYLLQLRNNGTNGQHFFWYFNNVLVNTEASGFDSIAQKGTYHVKLVVTDTNTCIKRDSVERTFYVFPETYTDFTFIQDTCSLNMSFTNNSIILPGDTANYLWDFGDGSSSTAVNPTHQYDDTGTYVVKLTANLGFPCSQFFEKPVTLKPGDRILNAFFDVSDTYFCEPVIFTAKNQSQQGQTYYWLIDDVIKDSSLNFTDTIVEAGVVKISLIAKSNITCLKADTYAVTIPSYSSANAEFITKKDSCSNNVLIKNLSSSNSQIPPTYVWYFGDGDSSLLENPVHAYTDSGNYQITLITNSNTPCADTARTTIRFIKDEHLLNASFNLQDSQLCTPAYVQATNTSQNGKQFYWYLNNVQKKQTKDYKDTITLAGDYELMLITVDSNTCAIIDTARQFFNVDLFANADFVMKRDSCSLNVVFENKSASNGVPFVWFFGDGDSSKQQSPMHTYDKSGYYKVTLLYNPGSYCADTLEQLYFIDGDSAQEIKIPNVFTPNDDGLNDCFQVTGVNPKCDEYYIKIFNRWGNVVYENTDGTHCWNGKSQAGIDIPDGVYYYIMNIKKKNGPSINDHGTVTVIR
ncbi:MAG: PKD domain-containing protein [Bacteroidetes bacterium]|nr:MAG: PKD domain-containing protein [Bacteroidota bacterium]